MIVCKKDFGSVEFLQDIPCVVWKPLKFMNSGQFQSLLTCGIEFYKSQKVIYPDLYWLNDTKKLKAISLGGYYWFNEIINEQAEIIGLKYMAFLRPENDFGRLAVRIYIQNTLKRLDNPLTIKIFENQHDAIQWLRSHNMQMVY